MIFAKAITLPEHQPLTPIAHNTATDNFTKQDHRFMDSGCKFRNFLRQAEGAKMLTTFCSAVSPKQCVVSDVGEHLNIPTAVFVPPRKIDTPETDYVKKRGFATVHQYPTRLYQSVLRHDAIAFAEKHGGVMLDNNADDLPEVAWQVKSLMEWRSMISRIVIPAGRGYALAAVLIGMRYFGLTNEVIAVAVTDVAKVAKNIRDIAALNIAPMHERVNIVKAKTPNYNDMAFVRDGDGEWLDCGYEAKAAAFRKRGDILWSCSRRPLGVINNNYNKGKK